MTSDGGAAQRVDWTARLEAFLSAPRDVILSQPFPAPAPLHDRVRCSVIEPPAGALDAGEGAGWESLALRALDASEQAAWRAIGGPKRRGEWLLGRIAAKDAVRLHLLETRGLRMAPHEIPIATDAWGRPTPRNA